MLSVTAFKLCDRLLWLFLFWLIKMENPPNVNAQQERSQASQSSHPASSEQEVHNVNDLAKIAALEGQVKMMKDAMIAAGLIKETQEQQATVVKGGEDPLVCRL